MSFRCQHEVVRISAGCDGRDTWNSCSSRFHVGLVKCLYHLMVIAFQIGLVMSNGNGDHIDHFMVIRFQMEMRGPIASFGVGCADEFRTRRRSNPNMHWVVVLVAGGSSGINR